MNYAIGRRLQLEALEKRYLLSFSYPAYVDGEFSFGDPNSIAPYGFENTFLLESKPSATKTIYIDFDGHHSTNNGWGHNIMFPPFSTDGNNQEFSNVELEEIQLTFQNVAEDFISFDINVTTKDPGVEALRKSSPDDEEFGLRVIATQATDGFGAGIGGVAQFNIFDSPIDTPVFAFNKGENAGGMTVSHEVGHGLGLRHDGLNGSTYHPGTGSGPTSWGPLMGAPFSSTVTQWSPGDYAGNTNTEDDYTLITRPQHGFTFRTDDFGDDQSDASDLTLSGLLYTWGVIEENTDVDAFTFDFAGGDLELNINSFLNRPNLDIEARLLDANGNTLEISNPANSTSASIALEDLAAGEYTLLVDGVGLPGVYTDYGSIGFYTVEGPALVGDFNADGFWNCTDVDLLVDHIANQQDAGGVTLDNFEDYSAGGLDVDRTGQTWRFGDTGVNPPGVLADDGVTIVPLLDIGADGSNQFLAGTSSHGLPNDDPKPDAANTYTSRLLRDATVDENGNGTIEFDLMVTADDRSPVEVGFSTRDNIERTIHFTGNIRVIPNRFDNAGQGPLGDGVADTFSLEARDAFALTDVVTGLEVNQWHKVVFDIDTAANSYDVLVNGTLVADDFDFRTNIASGDIRTFGFAGLAHSNSTSPVYANNDGVRVDNLGYQPPLTRFDMNFDGLVDTDDLSQWLIEAGRVNLPSGGSYLVGDANLDGTVDGLDFIIWNESKFSNTSAWCQGDFNADGLTDGMDFIEWNENKFTSADVGDGLYDFGSDMVWPLSSDEYEYVPNDHSHGELSHSHAVGSIDHDHDELDHDDPLEFGQEEALNEVSAKRTQLSSVGRPSVEFLSQIEIEEDEVVRHQYIDMALDGFEFE